MRSAARRVVNALVLLFLVSLLCFVFARVAPGDFFSELRADPRVSNETIEGLRAHYGLGGPLPVQYARWFVAVLRGELGYSLAFHVPVSELLAPRLRNTLLLTTTSLLLSWIVALILGTVGALARNGWLDRILTAVATALLCLPDVILAAGLLALATSFTSLPAGGMATLDGGAASSGPEALDLARHMLLPVLALSIGTVPVLMRHVQSAVAGVLDAPYIRIAASLGVRRGRLLWRHVLPAAANPLISLLGLSIGGLLSASLIVEVVMSWPGLGPLFLQAILARDTHVVAGAVLISAVTFVIGSVIADLLLVAVDPRVAES
jgi:peptide/nickel transport system permease protein